MDALRERVEQELVRRSEAWETEMRLKFDAVHQSADELAALTLRSRSLQVPSVSLAQREGGRERGREREWGRDRQ